MTTELFYIGIIFFVIFFVLNKLDNTNDIEGNNGRGNDDDDD